mgnify:CR=1 FL=1
MWISEGVLSWFKVSTEAFAHLREDNAALRAESATLKVEGASLKSLNEWMRLRLNALEGERSVLISKVHGINIATPEIVQRPPNFPSFNVEMFNDMGDDEARKQGLPVYGEPAKGGN